MELPTETPPPPPPPTKRAKGGNRSNASSSVPRAKRTNTGKRRTPNSQKTLLEMDADDEYGGYNAEFAGYETEKRSECAKILHMEEKDIIHILVDILYRDMDIMRKSAVDFSCKKLKDGEKNMEGVIDSMLDMNPSLKLYYFKNSYFQYGNHDGPGVIKRDNQDTTFYIEPYNSRWTCMMCPFTDEDYVIPVYLLGREYYRLDQCIQKIIYENFFNCSSVLYDDVHVVFSCFRYDDYMDRLWCPHLLVLVFLRNMISRSIFYTDSVENFHNRSGDSEYGMFTKTMRNVIDSLSPPMEGDRNTEGRRHIKFKLNTYHLLASTMDGSGGSSSSSQSLKVIHEKMVNALDKEIEVRLSTLKNNCANHTRGRMKTENDKGKKITRMDIELIRSNPDIVEKTYTGCVFCEEKT